MPTNDNYNYLRWITESEADLLNLVRYMRQHPDLQNETFYAALHARVRKAAESETT